MALVPTRNCGNCRFWSEDGKYTHCRRAPPRAFDHENSGYPIVPWYSRCGEYRMRITKLFKRYDVQHMTPESTPK